MKPVEELFKDLCLSPAPFVVLDERQTNVVVEKIAARHNMNPLDYYFLLETYVSHSGELIFFREFELRKNFIERYWVYVIRNKYGEYYVLNYEAGPEDDMSKTIEKTMISALKCMSPDQAVDLINFLTSSPPGFTGNYFEV